MKKDFRRAVLTDAETAQNAVELAAMRKFRREFYEYLGFQPAHLLMLIKNSNLPRGTAPITEEHLTGYLEYEEDEDEDKPGLTEILWSVIKNTETTRPLDQRTFSAHANRLFMSVYKPRLSGNWVSIEEARARPDGPALTSLAARERAAIDDEDRVLQNICRGTRISDGRYGLYLCSGWLQNLQQQITQANKPGAPKTSDPRQKRPRLDPGSVTGVRTSSAPDESETEALIRSGAVKPPVLTQRPEGWMTSFEIQQAYSLSPYKAAAAIADAIKALQAGGRDAAELKNPYLGPDMRIADFYHPHIVRHIAEQNAAVQEEAPAPL